MRDKKVSTTSNNPITVSKENLLGVWSDGTTENATFEIGGDSIFYVDQMESFPYSLNGDSLTIVFQDMTFEGIVYFLGDTWSLAIRNLEQLNIPPLKNDVSKNRC